MSVSANLRRVHVCIFNQGNIAGEYMWATALGRDLYQLQNIPFNLYGLNFWDIVRATRHRAHPDPEIRFVVRRSGHRTLRIVFARDVPADLQLEVLHDLKPVGVGFENMSDGFYAVDLVPGGNLAAVCRGFEEWRASGLLDDYETCETRRPGSFDLPKGYRGQPPCWTNPDPSDRTQ